MLLLSLACGGPAAVPLVPPAATPTAVAPTPAPAVAKAPIAGTLCVEGEESLLTCGTTSDHLLSLCSRDQTMRYRYGKPGAVELEYPDKDQAVQDAFKWESTETQGSMGGAPGGQMSKLSFTRDGASYLIDERYVGEPPVIKLIVTPANGEPVTIDCDQHVDGNLSYVAVRMSLPVDEGQ